MDTTILAERRSSMRLRVFAWRCGLSAPAKLALAAGMACFTGLAAQVRLPVPWTPVPVTGQVFAVLLAGALLGTGYGGLSQVLYVGVGLAGVPWFTGFGSGFGHLIGVTGGYLAGFVVAAALVGRLTDRHVHLRGILGQSLLMMAAVGVIYLFGAVHFALVARCGPWTTLKMAVLPFIPFDLAKALAAAATAAALLPKTPYGAET